jgi:predicted DNA-binding transcriptional regulator YafY
VPRNAEVIRQWTVLREIEAARGAGATIDGLAALVNVSTRTIRRDLQALEEAGFPLFDQRSTDDGTTRWRIDRQVFKDLSVGLTLSELCALYFSRALLTSLANAPFRNDLERAFDKLTAELTPHMRRFLDQLPEVIATKAEPGSSTTDAALSEHIVARLLDARLHRRQTLLTYHSRSSDRTKEYLVHPYRLAYAQGAMYLLAYVPEYKEVRTFAVERIRSASPTEDRFVPIEELPAQAFPHSLGVHSGPPERIELEFQASVADYLKAREWHASQVISEKPAGGLRITLDVCRDRSLTSWILSFGPLVRVVSPDALAREIAAELERAAAAYASPGNGADRPAPA